LAYMSPMTRRNLRNGLLFISPWVIGFVLFILYPVVASFYYSLTRYNLMDPPQWVGLGNYQDLIFDDDLFITAIKNTLYFVALAVPLGIVFSLSTALLLNAKMRGISVFRTIYYLPTLVPAVASSIIFIMLLNPQFGVVNTLIRSLGLSAPGWISDPAWAKPALIMMSLWGTGGSMIIFLAALQDVPEQLIEAAILDGANAWKRFLNVTLPMISPALLFNVIMGLIGGFQVFTSAYVMTDGGPNNSTLFYALLLYRNAFRYFKMGYASAMAWILFVITLIFTLIVMRSSARMVYYGGEE
jgi:multiple sugar transport system permease protein